MEFKMNRNGSGYYDETAYKAIQGMAKAGEIWEYNNKNVLIIKNHGNHCSALSLLTEPRGDNCIEIHAHEVLYTDPSMLQYVYTNLLGQSVAVLKDGDFMMVIEEIERSLGLDTRLKISLVQADKRIQELKTELERLEAKHTDLGSEAIYKRLYEDIIDKLIDKKVI